MPMAVNEYWRNSYPRSYVRKLTNIDGSTPTLFGNIFAIFGARAEDNNTPSNHSGYVVLDYRTTNFDGSINSDGTQSWYHILNPPSSVFSCSNCLAGTFNGPISPPSLNASVIQNEAEAYLQNGYPDNVILPTAIKEEPRTLTNPYPAINYTNPTSECPFASVGYIRTSRSGGTSSTNYSPGDKIVTAVFDGLVQNLGAGLPSVITFVGYALIQVDGYSSKNPNQIGNPNFFEDKKNNPNSLYGHALDFVEPSSVTTPPGTCDNSLFLNLRDMAYRGGTVHLVR